MNRYQREQTLAMSHDVRKNLTGQFGENLVNRYYQQNDYTVRVNALQFDESKDLQITKANTTDPWKTVEVKAVSLFYKHHAFFFEMSQIQKIASVDHFVIVQLPHPYRGLEPSVVLYEVPRENRTVLKLESSVRIPGRGESENFSIPRGACDKIAEIHRDEAPAIYSEAVILPPRDDRYQLCDEMQNYFNDCDSLSDLPV